MASHDPSELRQQLLRALYLRRAGAFTARFLSHTLNHRNGTSHTEGEVTTELAFLESKGLTTSEVDELGSNIRHLLTATGTLYCERHDLDA